MKKLAINLLICSAILCSNTSVMAKDNSNISTGKDTFITITTKDGKKNLNLNDILNMVEKNNMNIKLLNEKLELSNKMYDRNLNIAQSLDNDRDKSKNYYNVDFRKKQMLYYKQNALECHNIENERDEKIKEVKRGLKWQYFTLVNATKELYNIKEKINNIDNQIKKIESLHREGQGKLTDIYPLKVKKETLKASMDILNFKQEEALTRVKQFLGIDIKDVIEPNLKYCTMPFVKYDDSNIKMNIDKSILNNYDVKRKNKEIEYANLESHIYEVYGRNVQDENTNIELRIRDIKNSLEEYKLSLNINLWKGYYDLKNKEDLVYVEKSKLNQMQMAYDEGKLKLSKGLIDKITLDMMRLDFEGQKIALDKSINDYMLAVDTFKDLLG